MPERRARLAVLLSGRGSNFVALAEACEKSELPAEIVLVLSNVEGAPGIASAQRMGLPTAVVTHRGLSRRQHETAVLAELERASPDWICLAGYMRMLSPTFVARFEERIVNIHPSLLPAFPGLSVHEQVLEHGVKVSGCTVHLVDGGLDSGPIVVQRVVEVDDGETVESLASKVLEQEHSAYKQALRRLITERWAVNGRRLEFGPRGCS